MSEETKAKISKARMGQKNGPEARAKMSAAHLGKRRSAEARRAMSAAAHGRYGDPIQRFWANVDKMGPDECWPWTGALNRQGYGGKVRGGSTPHRMSYEIAFGPIPAGYQIDHACHDYRVCTLGVECPHRRCVNPRHLVAVTPRENVLRSGCPPAVKHRAAQARS